MARSPNYPAITPKEAIEDAHALWKKHQRETMASEEAAQSLGYKGLSGASRPRLAALKKYGILEKRGRGIALSDRAVDIAVRDPETQQYRKAVRDAIMDVELFAQLLAKHGDASRRMVEEHLVADLGFTPDGSKRAVEAFLTAKELLFLVGADTLSGLNTPEDDVDPKVGDCVQWTSQGQAQWPQPRPVLRVEDHDGEKFVFVLGDDGKEGGVPMSQVAIQAPEAPFGGPPPPPPVVGTGGANPPVGSKQDVFTLDSGESVTARWPDSITPDDYKDIQEWFKILERKIGRAVHRPDYD